MNAPTVFDPDIFLIRPSAGSWASYALPVKRELPASPLPPSPYTDIHWAHGSTARSASAGATYVARQRRGLAYEQRVCDVLAAIYGPRFVRSPAICYRFAGAFRRAILDGLLELDDGPVIIEVKLTHTVEVWNQVMLRYRPLVAALNRVGSPPRTVEVCRTYDPAVSVRHTLIQSLHAPAAPDTLEVLQWKI